jgi:hypothetical protein
MTRKSRRELERAVDDLAGDDLEEQDGLNVAVVWGDERADPDADFVVRYSVVRESGHE